MVYFVVVHYDVVDLLQVDFLLQTADELTVVGLPYGVDERNLLVADEI